MTSKKLVKLVLVFVLLVSLIPFGNGVQVNAYVSALGNMISYSLSGDQLHLVIDNGVEPNNDILEIQVADSNVLKVNYRPNGISSSASTPIIDPNLTWSSVGATINATGNPIKIDTSEMKIEIQKSPVRMTIKKADGTTLLWEPTSGGTFYDGVRFVHNTSDRIYGIRSFDAMEDVGGILRNDNSHAAHAGHQGDAGGPFMWSTSGYGLLVDSDGGYPYTESATGKMEFYYGGTPVEGRRYAKSNVEYYVMLGNPYDIMESYAKITGTSPMMPKWSLGLSNFEWGINQTELINSIDKYRASNIPLDAYALDYDWKRYGDDNYGEFAWNTTNFPSSSTTALKSTVNSKGIELIGITKPRIITRDLTNNRTTQYYDAEAGGYWYPGHNEYTDYFIPVTVRSLDPYKPEVRDWLWEHSEDAFDKGIVGWWNDETDKVSSGAAQYWFGNYATLHWSQAMYEGQREYTNDQVRVWQTGRTYYPGTQRYATSLWSGDIGSQFYKGELFSWATGMQEQLPIMLSAINMGQPKWGMDAGGFNQPDGMVSNPNPELYARWMQLAAMTPVFRLHGNYNQQRQPWYYGNTAEEISKSAIHLRYALLPYMYTYERSAYETGVGLVRPLIFDYPNDATVANLTDSWMFGDYILASPVVGKNQHSKQIYLPAGTWIDYFRGHSYSGNQTIHYKLNSESWTDIPLFIKEGAIIPTQEVLNHVDEKEIELIEVDVFPSTAQTSFMYYDDDGATYNYEGSNFFKQELHTQNQGTLGYNFVIDSRSGTYTPDVEYYLLKLHGKAGTTVTNNSASLTSYGDLAALKSAVGAGFTVGKDIYGTVTYVKVPAALASTQTIQVTGNTTVTASEVKYEAEEASLSGATLATMAAVNNNHSGYSGAGFVDSLQQDEAAVTYYVDVANSGDYPVSLRYANATGYDRSVSIFVNGERLQSTELPSLSSWSTWGNKTEVLPLAAGRNIISYEVKTDVGDTGQVNIDYISVPFNPNQIKVELETAKLAGSASTDENHWFYSGTSFVNGITTVGASAEVKVDVPNAGTYNVNVRYANGTGSNKTMSFYANGVDIRQNTLGSSGYNWNEWQEYNQTVTLAAGMNTLMFRYDSADSGNVNLDRVLISASPIAAAKSEVNLLDNGGFERTSSNSNWAEWHPTGQSLAFGVDSGNNMNPPEPAWIGKNRAYFHLASSYKQSIHQAVNVPVNNANYKFEAWVRLSGAIATTARAEISSYGGSRMDYNMVPNGEWTYISIDNIYVTTGSIDVGFYVDSPGGTVLHIDQVKLMKK